MRTLLVLLVITPLLSSAQINRSANLLAQETTKDYIQEKLFKGQAYTAGTFGELKSHTDKNDPEIEWVLEHNFEILRRGSSFDKKSKDVRQPYRFIFFLNHQMKVKKAESYRTGT